MSRRPAALVQSNVDALEGLGRRQIAVEYAYRHAVDARAYNVVWWARVDYSARFLVDYAELARHLDLPEKDDPRLDVVVAAVKAWLESHGGWLLLIDSAYHPDDIRAHLPQGGGGPSS